MRIEFTIRWAGKLVALYANGRLLTSMHYKVALDVARQLRQQAAGVTLYNQAARGLAGITEEKGVMLTIDGKAICELPPDATIKLANAITAQAHQAESLAQVGRIIDDSALMIRAGIPFALTHNDDVFNEALKEANTNRTLRRAIPHIQSSARAWPIGLIQHPPRNGNNGGNHGNN